VRRDDESATGIVFNVQRYSLHDGQGIRTLVFLKECPLRCRWCSNPESQRREPEIARNARRCLGVETCRYCGGVCSESALRLPERGAPEIERDSCTACGSCAAKCPATALHLYGARRSASDILDQVELDSPFYARSGGGMTLSGGEPLAQGDFALALLREAKRRHVDSAVETCGLVPWETLAAAAGLTREMYFDLKVIDPDLHAAWTGRNNRAILRNLEDLLDAFPVSP
jgi:pyruvate formate lyase activating enzyme